MYVCPNCNYQSATPMHFCFNCGAKTVYIENQQPQQPYQQQYQQPQQPYQQPYQQSYQQQYQPRQQYYEHQRPSNLGKKIPSIILGAFGLVFAVIDISYTLLFLAVAPEASFVFAIVFSIFSLPLSIVGRVLSRKCMDEGDDSKSAGTGAGLGLAGIILTIISLALGFIALAGA